MVLADYILWLVLGLNGLHGFVTGLTRQIAGLLGVLLGLTAAFRYYGPVAEAMEQYWHLQTYLAAALSRSTAAFPGLPELVVRLISLVLVFAVVNLAIHFAGVLAGGLVKAIRLTLLDRVAGAGLGIVKGLLLISIGLRLLNLLALPGVEAHLRDSRYAGSFAVITERIFREVETLVPDQLAPLPILPATESV